MDFINGMITPFATAEFKDLPPELRNRIYALVVPVNGVFSLNKGQSNIPRYNRYISPPAICQTCRYIRNETLPIWRSSNTFIAQTNNVCLNLPVDASEILLHHCPSGLRHIQQLDRQQVWEVPEERHPGMWEKWLRIRVVVKNDRYNAEISDYNGLEMTYWEDHPDTVRTAEAKIAAMVGMLEVFLERKLDKTDEKLEPDLVTGEV